MKENLFLLTDKFLRSNRILNEDRKLELDILSLTNINIYNLFKIISKYGKNIDIYDISESNLVELPKTFIGTNKYDSPILISKRHNKLFNEQVETTRAEIGSYIIASSEKEDLIKYITQRYSTLLFPILITIIFIGFLYIHPTFKEQKQFMLLSLLGTFLAYLSNKDFFSNISVLNNFCSEKCSSVQESKDWKILKYINFGELSLTYFLTQITVFVLFRENIYLLLFKISYLSSFFIVISIAYQFYLRKTCKICIFISIVLFLQIISSYNYDISLKSSEIVLNFINFCATFFLVYYFILLIKKYKGNSDFYKSESIKAKKISNNPEYINRIIFNGQKILAPELLSVLDSKIEKIVLFIHTSIKCNHCKDLHTYLKLIINDFGEKLDLRFSFFIDFDDPDEELMIIYKTLVLILIRGKFEEFHQILGEIYEESYENINSYPFNPTSRENLAILNYFAKSKHWADHNNIYYAPFILINNHQFSHEFEYNILYDVVERLILDYEEISIL